MRTLIVSVVLALVFAVGVAITGQSLKPSDCSESVTKLITEAGGNFASITVVAPNRVKYMDIQTRVTIPSVPVGMVVDRSASRLPPISSGGSVYDAGMITIICDDHQ